MQQQFEEIQSVLSRYGIKNVTRITPLSKGFANRNYKVRTQDENFLYRVCTQQENMAHIRYEIRILSELAKMNFPTARLIPRKDGAFLSESAEGWVLLYEFIDGSEPAVNRRSAAEIGHYIARLNLFPDYENYPRENVIQPAACFELIREFKTAPSQYPDIYAYFEDQTHELVPRLSENLPKGLIHGDVFPDNTLFKNGRLAALIDFEEVCTDVLLMEIAMCINGFCFVDNRLDASLVQALLDAYHKVRPITEPEFERLYDYIRWTAHGMISWHLRFFLIHRENDRQLARVNELVERMKILQSSPEPKIKRPKI